MQNHVTVIPVHLFESGPLRWTTVNTEIRIASHNVPCKSTLTLRHLLEVTDAIRRCLRCDANVECPEFLLIKMGPLKFYSVSSSRFCATVRVPFFQTYVRNNAFTVSSVTALFAHGHNSEYGPQ